MFYQYTEVWHTEIWYSDIPKKSICFLISNNMPFIVYLERPYLPDAELPYKDLKSHQSKINASVLA